MDQEPEPAERALPLEAGHQVVRERDALERLTEDKLPGMQDEGRVASDLDELGELLHRLPYVDVGIARVVEDPEAAVHPHVHARWLDEGGVEGVDHDPPRFDLSADRAVAEYHGPAIVATELANRAQVPRRETDIRLRDDRLPGEQRRERQAHRPPERQDNRGRLVRRRGRPARSGPGARP